MKRPALLIATECKIPRFDTLAKRAQLPFGAGVADGRNDYSLHDAYRLRLMLDAPKGIDNDTAQFIAKESTYILGNLPFYHTEGVTLYAGAMYVDGQRVAVAGRMADIAELADPVNGMFAGMKCGGLVLLNATEAAQKVQKALAALGLPQSEWLVDMPEDVSGFPEWFQKIETERRAMLSGWGTDTASDEA
jgi:hypothetical protein